MEFKTKPLDHQFECWELSKDKEYYALLCEAGTGKTKILIDTAAWLKFQNKIDVVIVVTTNNVHIKWLDEIEKHCSIDYYACAVKTKEFNKFLQFKDLKNITFNKLVFFTFNFQALLNASNQKFIENLCKLKRVLFIVDESHKIKNCRTKIAKYIHKISDKSLYRRIATGTPIGNAQQFDLYSQYLFLEKNIIGASSFWGFKATYGNFIPVSYGTRAFNKLISFKNLDKLLEKITPYSYVKTKEQCLDLPDKTYVQYPVTIQSAQKEAYNGILKDHIYLGNNQHFLSKNKLTDLMKMQQILSGFILIEENELEGINWICPHHSNPKWEAAIDILEDFTGKVIIWSRFRAEIRNLAEYIKYCFKNDDICEKLDGDVLLTKRCKIIKDFQEKEYPKYIIANMNCNIEGLDFYAASTAIYLSNSFSWIARSQSEDRIHRIGQEKKCTYIDIVVPKSIDEKILRTLKNCKDITNDIYYELINGSNI